MDRPEQIHANAILSNKEQHDVASIKWTRIVGVEQVCRHLCLVAAGMATRPNRPHRPVFFRPFSSRDAHILLQLKRISEVLATSCSNDGSAGLPVAKLLLDASLTAGKAARDVTKVPAIAPLQQYGSGSSRYYSSEPPAALTQAATEAAMQLAIEPTVQQCVAKFQAMKHSNTITQLRLQAEEMAISARELQWIKRQLHEPTLQLRQGENVDTLDILVSIQARLESLRRNEYHPDRNV
jgi:hypothetical protein